MKECLTFTGELVLPAVPRFTGGLTVPVLFSQPPMESSEVRITENGVQQIVPNDGFYGLSDVEVTADVQPPLEEVEVEISSGTKTIIPSDGYYGISKATVSVVDPDDKNPTWWSIESIVQAPENQEYPYKCIQLLPDDEVTSSLSGGIAYKTSDGAYYTTSTASHTWDASKDKPCEIDGISAYKTRWVIVYYQTAEIASFTVQTNCLYFVMDGLLPREFNIGDKPMLQSFRLLNGADTSRVTNFYNAFCLSRSLTSIPALDTSQGTNFTGMFNCCYCLASIPALDTSRGTIFDEMFQNCRSLTSIPALDTSQGTNFSNMFAYCFSLISIPALDISRWTSSAGMAFFYCYSLITARIKITRTGITLDHTRLNRESLLYILDNLPDASEGKVMTLRLDMNNLAKLTDEEKAIATAKNWTLT